MKKYFFAPGVIEVYRRDDELGPVDTMARYLLILSILLCLAACAGAVFGWLDLGEYLL